MKKAYIQPETNAFKMEVESMVCQSLGYDGSQTVGPSDPHLTKDMGFDADDIDLSFIE